MGKIGSSSLCTWSSPDFSRSAFQKVPPATYLIPLATNRYAEFSCNYEKYRYKGYKKIEPFWVTSSGKIFRGIDNGQSTTFVIEGE